MAHNLARHQGERISSSVVVSIIGAFSLLIDPSGSLLYFFAPAVRLFGQLPNSRIQESEADQIGMRLAAEACYDPEALSHVCRRTDKAGRDGNLANKPPEFLSSHPSDESRIKDMQKWLLEDRKIFNMYDGKRCREFRRQVNNPTNNRIFHHSHSREHEAPDGILVENEASYSAVEPSRKVFDTLKEVKCYVVRSDVSVLSEQSLSWGYYFLATQ
eukprot:CAMPEP_0168169348 /NCGR_PEP_ID=MMETSP0139_2-20121125/3590_1 /TAXON_ID=44445 /ORGANISM="Pseudo-nitzschia australis, Strain 10249 10 AB" /LENGTH=214 /DNA_ID=CAMNT_0008086761 /DNA_START=256 /DNA_END=901 /DNA_ORIENTATION=-